MNRFPLLLLKFVLIRIHAAAVFGLTVLRACRAAMPSPLQSLLGKYLFIHDFRKLYYTPLYLSGSLYSLEL